MAIDLLVEGKDPAVEMFERIIKIACTLRLPRGGAGRQEEAPDKQQSRRGEARPAAGHRSVWHQALTPRNWRDYDGNFTRSASETVAARAIRPRVYAMRGHCDPGFTIKVAAVPPSRTDFAC
jgi:hypothetical protein